jgi:hypothetical protein
MLYNEFLGYSVQIQGRGAGHYEWTQYGKEFGEKLAGLFDAPDLDIVFKPYHCGVPAA